MSGKLVKTVFQTGPEDELAAVDVYEGGGGTENTYDDKRAEAIDTMAALTEEASADSNDESFATTDGQEAASEDFSFNDIIDRMDGEQSGITGFLNNLSQTAKSLFNLLPTQSSVFSNNTSIGGSVNISDLKAIVNIINTLSNDNFKQGVVDKGAQAKLITTSVTSISNAGLNGSYQALDKNPNIDRTVLRDSAVEAIKNTVVKGNLGVALDVSQTDIMTDVINKDPGIIKTILSSSTLLKIPLKDQSTLFKVFTDSFTKADSKWNTVYLRDTLLTDLKDFSFSDQMKELLRYNIFNLPLTVLVNENIDNNPAFDKELDTDINSVINKNFNNSVDMYAGSQFPIIDLKTALDQKFEYLNINNTSTVTRQNLSIY